MNEKFLSRSALALLALLALLLAACEQAISPNPSPDFSYVPITGQANIEIMAVSPSVVGSFDVLKYTFAVAAEDIPLPPGLKVDADTGEISGAPKEGVPDPTDYTITATPEDETLEPKTTTVNITVTGKADLSTYNPYFVYEPIFTSIGTSKTQGFANDEAITNAGGGAFSFQFEKSDGSYSNISDTDEISIAADTGVITVTDQADFQLATEYMVKVEAAAENIKWRGFALIPVSIAVTKIPLATGTIVAGWRRGKVVIGLKALASPETGIEQYVVQYRKKTSSGSPVPWSDWADATDGSGGKKTFGTGASLTDANAATVDIGQPNQFPANPAEKDDYQYRLQSVVEQAGEDTRQDAESVGITAETYSLNYSNVKTGLFAGRFIRAGVAISTGDQLNMRLVTTSSAVPGNYNWSVVDKGLTNGLATMFDVNNTTDIGQITTNATTTAGNVTVKAVPKPITNTDGSIEATVGGDLTYDFEVFDKLPYTIAYTDVTGQMKDSKLLQNVDFSGSALTFTGGTTAAPRTHYDWSIAPTNLLSPASGAVDLDIESSASATLGNLKAVDAQNAKFKKGTWTVTASPKTTGTNKADNKEIASGDVIRRVTVIGKKIVLDYSIGNSQKGYFADNFIRAGATIVSGQGLDASLKDQPPTVGKSDYTWDVVDKNPTNGLAAKFSVANDGQLTTRPSQTTTAGTFTVTASPTTMNDEAVVSDVLEYDFTVFNQPVLSYSNLNLTPTTVPAKSSGNKVPQKSDWFIHKPMPVFNESLPASAYGFALEGITHGNSYVIQGSPPPPTIGYRKISIHTVTGKLSTNPNPTIALDTFKVTARPKGPTDRGYNAKAFAGGDVVFVFETKYSP